jgi:hypothetical protein
MHPFDTEDPRCQCFCCCCCCCCWMCTKAVHVGSLSCGLLAHAQPCALADHSACLPEQLPAVPCAQLPFARALFCAFAPLAPNSRLHHSLCKVWPHCMQINWASSWQLPTVVTHLQSCCSVAPSHPYCPMVLPMCRCRCCCAHMTAPRLATFFLKRSTPRNDTNCRGSRHTG